MTTFSPHLFFILNWLQLLLLWFCVPATAAVLLNGDLYDFKSIQIPLFASLGLWLTVWFATGTSREPWHIPRL